MPFGNNDQPSTKNVLIALVAFAMFMFAYNYFFGDQNGQVPHNTASQTVSPEQAAESKDDEFDANCDGHPLTVTESLSKNSRIRFENGKISGSVDLVGGIVDELSLKEYKETTDVDSSNVMLLNPKGTNSESYYAISYKDKTHDELISNETVWTKTDSTERSVTIRTQTQNGMIIERTIVIDDGYLISIKDKVINVSDKNLMISVASNLVRVNPNHANYAVVHDGIVGHFDGSVDEIKYSNIHGETVVDTCDWVGYTDIYWLTALINKNKNMSVSYVKSGDDSYKCSTHSKKDIKVTPNSVAEISYLIFAGPKDIKILNEYAARLDLPKFEMSIDFGWFFMLTKPLLYFLGLLGQILPNMWLVILVLTLLFKILTFPLMQKSFKSAAKMRELQPKLASIQKLYANDKPRMNQEVVALYKKEKASPMSGCFPMLLQAPIFFCLYKVFFISIDMRHAPLFGWIHDLSAPDPVYIFNLFGFIDWTPPGFLRIGVWPLIMGITMILQQKLSSGMSGKNPTAEKTTEMKMQENMMLIMPVLFTYICASFPVGVVIYWTISNLFTIAQQYYANSGMPNLGVRRKK
ncbi:MAG: membrane protein insertase YidC [Holosporales bacterium]|jgi:YidC/Oxa1 family membrane protein insertase|nr:membrane protein insertase YidC [Holosporales bacterium]